LSKYSGIGGLLSDPEFLLRLQYDNTGSAIFPQGDQTVFNVDHNGRTQIGDFPIVPGDDYLAVRSSAGIYHTTTEYFRLRYANNNHELFWLSNGNRNFRFRNSNTGAIPLTLSPAGKVGVGTANFAGNHALHVKGTGVHEDIYVQAENSWGQDNSFARLVYTTAPQIWWKSSTNANFEFKSGDQTPLRLSPQGKVGVNTSNFVGSYSLYIKGTTIAEEIFVKIEDDWGDYVFEPDYVLQPLNEVEAFVKEHKHLPGIAPAAEIHSTGIPLGETERMLVVKVEELTLYLIELKKELDDLKGRLQEAEKQK
jgi:hypothetical protein